jgi:putative SOS response-associated peptidase YedK
MCTRYVLKSDPKKISQLFKLEETIQWKPSYNIAPSRMVPAVIRPLDGRKRVFKMLRWGFVAAWTQGGRLVVNTRAEDIQDRPLFQESFEKWRCLVPMDGFYEWRHEAKETRPFYFKMKDDRPFAVAGIWASQALETGTMESLSLMTTTPNEAVRAIHDRMPVILEEKDFGLWMDTQDVRDFEKLKELLKPYPGDKMTSIPVSSRVNKTTFDEPQCIDISDEPETLSLGF